MVLKDKLFKSRKAANIAWLLFEKTGRITISIVVSVYLARQLGVDKFGSLSFLISYSTILLMLGSLGIDDILLKRIVKIDREHISHELSVAFTYRMLGALIVYALGLIIFDIFLSDKIGYFNALCLIGLMVFITPFQVINVLLLSKTKSKYSTLSRLIPFLVSGGLKIFSVIYFDEIIFISYAFLFEYILEMILLYLFLKRMNFSLTFKINYERIHYYFKQGYPLIIASIFYLVYIKIDQIMLGVLSSSSQVGFYSISVRFSEAFNFVSVAIISTFLPQLMKSRENNQEFFNRDSQLLMDFLVKIAVSICVVITLISPSLINLLYGDEFLISSRVLMIHVWSLFFVYTGTLNSRLMIIDNLQKISMYRTGVGALINVALNFILIPEYGAIGAAIATIIAKFIASYFSNAFFLKTRIYFKMQNLAIANLFNIRNYKDIYARIQRSI